MNMKNFKYFGAVLLLLPMFSWATLIEFNGKGGTYDAANKWISFSAGYMIDIDVEDSNPDSTYGTFIGALKGGFLSLGSSRYELDLFNPKGLDILTRDYAAGGSPDFGTLNFGNCNYINDMGDALQMASLFRSYPDDDFYNAGTSLLGLAAIPLYFESDAELNTAGVARYASLDIWTVAAVPEPTSLLLLLLGFSSIVGVRFFKLRRR
jgi:hypothetical protein